MKEEKEEREKDEGGKTRTTEAVVKPGPAATL